MTPTLDWSEIAVRLTLSAIAGTLVGLNREGHGRPAGLRTNLIVCMAAAVSMIQANLLLATVGKSQNSFVSMDIMRLPLGILTGMGFIGGGAILKKDDVVIGVTTAATLWFVTVIGLCFGGGQNGLGLAALAIAMLILWGLKRLEGRLVQSWRGLLTVVARLQDGPADKSIPNMLQSRGFQLHSFGASYHKSSGAWSLRYELRWRVDHSEDIQSIIQELSERSGVEELTWTPQGLA